MKFHNPFRQSPIMMSKYQVDGTEEPTASLVVPDRLVFFPLNLINGCDPGDCKFDFLPQEGLPQTTYADWSRVIDNSNRDVSVPKTDFRYKLAHMRKDLPLFGAYVENTLEPDIDKRFKLVGHVELESVPIPSAFGDLNLFFQHETRRTTSGERAIGRSYKKVLGGQEYWDLRVDSRRPFFCRGKEVERVQLKFDDPTFLTVKVSLDTDNQVNIYHSMNIDVLDNIMPAHEWKKQITDNYKAPVLGRNFYQLADSRFGAFVNISKGLSGRPSLNKSWRCTNSF
jgi:hypothetical protein